MTIGQDVRVEEVISDQSLVCSVLTSPLVLSSSPGTLTEVAPKKNQELSTTFAYVNPEKSKSS